MSTERVLRVARLMRDRAATVETWSAANPNVSGWPLGWFSPVFIANAFGEHAAGDADDPVLQEGWDADARHIAPWTPAVALALASWLEDIATRHGEDPDPVELVLHPDELCPTGDCVDPGYHEGCIVCTGCYPSWDGMDGRALWPCTEFKAALTIADAYLEAVAS